MKSAENFRKRALSPSIRLFLLQKLPLAFLAGVRVRAFDENGTSTSIRFRWINQNPFRSMYFAAMHMAAELATGLLLFQYMNKEIRFSMLLINTQASFTQKAVGKITFTCKQGQESHDFITRILFNTEGETINLNVVARNEDGNEIATFTYTWSCRKK